MNFGTMKELVEVGMKIQVVVAVDMNTVVAVEVEQPKGSDFL